MVRPNRIKTYKFQPNELTSDSNGNLSVYSDRPINGTIHKIVFEAGNYTSTGSLWTFVSGTSNEQIYLKKGVSSNFVAYPFVYTEDLSSATGSPYAFNYRVAQDHLCIAGSGLGNGKSGLGLTIHYI